jgi:hypothetical protein
MLSQTKTPLEGNSLLLLPSLVGLSLDEPKVSSTVVISAISAISASGTCDNPSVLSESDDEDYKQGDGSSQNPFVVSDSDCSDNESDCSDESYGKSDAGSPSDKDGGDGEKDPPPPLEPPPAPRLPVTTAEKAQEEEDVDTTYDKSRRTGLYLKYGIENKDGATGLFTRNKIPKHQVIGLYSGTLEKGAKENVSNYTLLFTKLSESQNPADVFCIVPDGAKEPSPSSSTSSSTFASPLNGVDLQRHAMSAINEPSVSETENCYFYEFLVEDNNPMKACIAVLSYVDIEANSELLLLYGDDYNRNYNVGTSYCSSNELNKDDSSNNQDENVMSFVNNFIHQNNQNNQSADTKQYVRDDVLFTL